MKTASYKEGLLRELKELSFAAEYLAQALESDDQTVFLLGLKDVVQARGGAAPVAKQARIQRETIYKTLSKRGNPRLNTLQGILKSVGLRLAIVPQKSSA